MTEFLLLLDKFEECIKRGDPYAAHAVKGELMRRYLDAQEESKIKEEDVRIYYSYLLGDN